MEQIFSDAVDNKNVGEWPDDICVPLTLCGDIGENIENELKDETSRAVIECANYARTVVIKANGRVENKRLRLVRN